jgi:dCMP deaminase
MERTIKKNKIRTEIVRHGLKLKKENEMNRPTWDEYFLSVMDATALRASCDRGKSACVIVKDNRILATGYVGAPSGLPSCDEVEHQLIRKFEIDIKEFENCVYVNDDGFVLIDENKISVHCIRTVHAEQNAIVNCARAGISTLGATMYVTMTPCRVCAMIIIQAGISKVIAKNKYQKDSDTREMFKQANICLEILSEKELY